MSNKFIDLTGQKFNRWSVLERTNNKQGRSMWLCRCNCKNEKIVSGHDLKNGDSKSCGCLNIERITEMGKNTRTHGHTINGKISKTYSTWNGMVQRCINPNNQAYNNYGGRGIKVCKRWLKFKNFIADIGEIPVGKEIDRINNNGNYKPNNVKLSTRKEQRRNMRNNRMITFNGKTQCLMDWSKELNIPYGTLRQRLYKFNWSIKRAFTIPSRSTLYSEIKIDQ